MYQRKGGTMLFAQRLKVYALSILWLWAAGAFFLAAAAEEKIQVILPESDTMTELRKAVDARIESLSGRMIEINDWMYYNPEPGFLEFKASSMLAEELEKHGFTVEMGVPGLKPDFDRLKMVGGFPSDYQGPSGIPTAFKAKWESEHPVIGIAIEYDALRGNPPFHGCQHNMQGPVGVGAAIALAEIMEKNNIPGSVWVIGCPAEEVGPPTKAVMAKTGYFDGIDFMMRSHGTSRETLRYPGGFSARHIRQMKYTFHGKSAHAQRAWQGKSALDAVLLLFHSIDMIREHSEPQFRFHGIISEGGAAPNIVPDLAAALASGTEGIPEAAGHSQENADITVSEAGHKSLILTSKVLAAVGLRLILDSELRRKVEAEHKEWVKKYEE
jgi:metal-dependent amidase/aminoacylase/carboxypeptidase family protein